MIGACFSTVSFIEPFISPDKKQQDMEIASMIPILMPSFSLLRLPINNPIDTPIRLPNREIIEHFAELSLKIQFQDISQIQKQNDHICVTQQKKRQSVLKGSVSACG